MKQIAVLDRGWVYVGDCTIEEGFLIIRNGHNIRRWGAHQGLGHLAIKGVQPSTIMDSVPTVKVPMHSINHLIDCDEAAWNK